MRFHLEVRERADEDIDEIAEYIAGDNLGAGRRFYECVWAAIESSDHFRESILPSRLKILD